MKRVILSLSLLSSSLYSFSIEEQQQAEQLSKKIQKQEQINLERNIKKIESKTEKINIEAEFDEKKVKKKFEKCWSISNIILDGVTLLSKESQVKITAEYTKECIKLHQLNELLNDITKAYFDRGYIMSRVYIKPKQNLNRGVIELFIDEGKLQNIVLEDYKDNNSIDLDWIFPNMIDKALNLRDIEQGLEQINRLSSNSATMKILPGFKDGESILLINNDVKDEIPLTFTYDNQGSEATGERQIGVATNIDNFVSTNHVMGLTLNRSLPFTDEQYSISSSLNYSVPYGYNTFIFSSSKSEYKTVLDLDSGLKLNSSGDTLNILATFDRVVYRDKIDKVSFSTTIATKSSKSYLNDALLDVSSYDLSIVDIGFFYSTILNNAMVDFKLKYYRGLDIADKNSDIALEPEFKKYTVDINYIKPFYIASKPALYSLAFSGQYSSDVLYGSEQISIGGFTSVRGFEGVSIIGDIGYYIRNDLTVNLNEYITLLLALDGGRIYSHNGSAEGILKGLGYGVKINAIGGLLELTKVDDISQPIDMVSSNKNDKVYINFSYKF
jgi:hemolysin activation/secretion protein